jgi:predicted TIM-barrel fold metal-dependent hydrolase
MNHCARILRIDIPRAGNGLKRVEVLCRIVDVLAEGEGMVSDFTGLGRPVIDCDLHNTFPTLQTLMPYLEDHWVAYIGESHFRGPGASDYPGGAPTSAREGTRPENGPPGSDLALMQEHVLDPWEVEVGILVCGYWVQSVSNEDLAVSLATAVNQWQIDHWLEKDDRLRASLVVPSQNPMLAAQEIERFGDHPGFVQVVVPVRSYSLYGKREYNPMYEAALKHDLVIGIHYGGASGIPPTPVGWPSTYIEESADMAQVFQAQVLSLIAEGAFSRFPDLRVALIESGFVWMPAWMWRMDKEWKGLRRDTPWVNRRPSDYVREHIRMTLQPMEAPPDPEHLLQAIGQLDSEELLVFSTDYPHWHFDGPEGAIPKGLSESLLEKILRENARAFYRL